MSEVVTIGDATLYLGDCRDVLHGLSNVDHVVSDPPYEAHMHAAKRGEKVHGSIRRIRLDGHANPPPVDFTSIDDIRDWAAAEAVRLADGWVLLFCTPEGVAPWRDAIEATGAKYKRACVWVKPDAAPQFNGQGPAMGAEMFVAAWAGQGYSRWNAGGKRGVYTHNVNTGRYGAGPEHPRGGGHPTEKPLTLMAELIADFTQPGDLILDPFMGSGTTGVACLKDGRRFIGIEQKPEYFAIACRRMREARINGELFQAPPAKAVQPVLMDMPKQKRPVDARGAA